MNNLKNLLEKYNPKANLKSDDNRNDVEKTIELEKLRLAVEERHKAKMRAYLVSVEFPENDPEETRMNLQELGSLVRSLNDDCVGVIVQKRDKPAPSTFIGSGKAVEIRDACLDLNAEYVVFDQELSASQVRNLEKIFGIPVLDRTSLILQIFRKNARSREAKTQVDIARLEYLAPRLSNEWIAWERQRGGGSGGTKVKGAGESQIELDRRKIKDKVAALKKELEKIRKERSTQRKSRMDEWNVVLVGYTNAGKTTIMNGLTESHLSARDSLFETLDSSVRRLSGGQYQGLNVLITDTVGFIRKLPHGLVASFRSTLEETAEADLLLHVVDVSHPLYKEHMKVTNDVLRDVGAGEVPQFIIFNKWDNIQNEPRLGKILKRAYPNSICISGQNKDDTEKLKQAISDYFVKNMVEETIEVNYHDKQMMSFIHTQTKILQTDWQENVVVFRIRMPVKTYQKYFNQKGSDFSHE